MNSMPAAQLITAEDYLAMDDIIGRRTDLVNGEIVMAEPTYRHQLVSTRIVEALLTWAGGAPERGQPIMPLDVRLDEHNVYAPDVLWYSQARRPATRSPRPYAMPDIAAEVRSPSTWRYDVGVKKTAYERRGLPELWLADLAADEVLVFRRSVAAVPAFDLALELTADDALTSPLLPGFSLLLAALFAD